MLLLRLFRHTTGAPPHHKAGFVSNRTVTPFSLGDCVGIETTLPLSVPTISFSVSPGDVGALRLMADALADSDTIRSDSCHNLP